MDHRIALITTSHISVQKARKLFLQLNYDYPLIETSFDRIEGDAAKAISDGARIFISRGMSAEFLKKFELPVVSLRFTFHDFSAAIQYAKQFSQRIAIIGYRSSWYSAIEPYAEELPDTELFCLESPRQLADTIIKIGQSGIKAVIGGVTTTKIAREHGLFGVAIDVENSSIIDALHEAQYLLQIELQRDAQISMINAILNSSIEGMIFVSPDGEIKNANETAFRLLGKDCVGHLIFQYTDDLQIRQAVRGDAILHQELITIDHTLCTVNTSPAQNSHLLSGCVLTFQPVKQVRSLDQSIRKKQAGSSNIAMCIFHDILGESPVMQTAIRQAKRFAQSEGTILLSGETGTGKEMFAQSIHNYSSRASGPFVAINCAAIPQSILESELFGYVRGAFTGASSEGKAGYFEMAHTGTIFLDEIGEIPLDMQIKLLRVLQEHEIRRVGDRKVFKLDARVIAATNKDLPSLVREGKFREDLYYRLAVLELHIPPLRERGNDIIQIAKQIIKEISNREKKGICRLSKTARDLLLSEEWRGNVRQLHNIIERAVILCDSGSIDSSLLRQMLGNSHANQLESPRETLTNFRKHEIAGALLEARGNRDHAAQLLGLSKTTLWRRIKEIQESDPTFMEKLKPQYR